MSHGAANVYGLQTYLQGTLGHGYRLFVYKVKNLLLEDCKSGMQSVYKILNLPPGDCPLGCIMFFTVSIPTSK